MSGGSLPVLAGFLPSVSSALQARILQPLHRMFISTVSFFCRFRSWFRYSFISLFFLFPCPALALSFFLFSGDASAAERMPQKKHDVAPAWRPLLLRLKADGLYGPDLLPLFAAMGGVPSQAPMGRKIEELYKKAFMPKPKQDSGRTTSKAPPLYPGVVTAANARRCADFIRQHRTVFASMENRYRVPREIAAALLFVETRLGDFLGNESAFLTLASMAASRDPAQIPDYVKKLPNAASRLDWIRERMEQRSDWAYREFTALLANVRGSSDPLAIPGSIYGAVGLCQFMPSNIARFGADGNGDGVIDLFTVPDAVASLSSYLVKNGWKPGLSRTRQHKILKTYNRVDVYANTILALADATREVAAVKP